MCVCVYGVEVGASLLASLRFLALTVLWLQNLSPRFLMLGVLNARPELYHDSLAVAVPLADVSAGDGRGCRAMSES